MMGYIFVKSIIDLNNPENSYSGSSLLGVQPPLAIAILGLLLGLILMGLQWCVEPGVLPAQARVRRSGDAAMSGTIVLGYDGSESADAALAER